MNSEIGEVFRASSLKEALAGMIILSWRFKGIIEETLKERKRLTVGMKPFTVDDFNDTLEIAAMTGIPHGTASSRLRRAREEFSKVAQRFRAHHEWAGGRS